MIYFLQLNKDNVITDAISYYVNGYIEFESKYPLPAGINGGWWKLEKGVLVEYPELRPGNEISEIKQRLATLEKEVGSIRLATKM